MRKPIPASETERIEHSAETEPLFRVATNLMRALDSIQPCANETTSLKDAEINSLSFLLGCNYAEAARWYPFFKKSLQCATERPHDDTVEIRGCGKRGSCPSPKLRSAMNSIA
jgi:hypothetical protein